jgi:hypothetical protein
VIEAEFVKVPVTLFAPSYFFFVIFRIVKLIVKEPLFYSTKLVSAVVGTETLIVRFL